MLYTILYVIRCTNKNKKRKYDSIIRKSELKFGNSSHQNLLKQYKYFGRAGGAQGEAQGFLFSDSI